MFWYLSKTAVTLVEYSHCKVFTLFNKLFVSDTRLIDCDQHFLPSSPMWMSHLKHEVLCKCCRNLINIKNHVKSRRTCNRWCDRALILTSLSKSGIIWTDRRHWDRLKPQDAGTTYSNQPLNYLNFKFIKYPSSHLHIETKWKCIFR